jgi:hypothetical protein
LHLAQDLGYFKENGLTVELPVVEEAAMYMAALDDSHGGDGVLGLFTDQLFRFLRLRITAWAQ